MVFSDSDSSSTDDDVPLCTLAAGRGGAAGRRGGCSILPYVGLGTYPTVVFTVVLLVTTFVVLTPYSNCYRILVRRNGSQVSRLVSILTAPIHEILLLRSTLFHRD